MNKLYNMKALKIVTIIYIVFLYGITSYAQITLSEIFNPSLQESDGWIEITAAGSAQPFFINLYLTGSNTPIASSDDVFITGNYRFEELAAGEYTVIVYDREGCETIIAPIILEDEPRCDIDYYVNTLKHATSIDYREQTSIDDGEIEVIISDPDRYELTWQGPAGFISTENHLTDLPSGRFILTIIDMLNSECQVTEEFYITYCRQLTFDYRDLPSVEIGEADVTSPTSGACNGQITVPPVINRSDNAFSLTWYQQDALLASSNTIQNLCPGTYTLIVEDGCHPTQMFEYTLYDCTENPIILEPTNNCTDLDYEGAFSLSINGGENAVILPEWSETGNGRIYFAVDDRGCTAQHEFKYSEIGDWDIQYEVIKPFNGIGDPIVEITILNADGDQAPFNMVGYRNLIPVNVPFQVILEGVEAGSLPVDFENKNSCVRRVWFDITDCVNYEEKTPITLDVNIDYEGDQSAFVNANPSQSCSDMTNVQLLIQGGLAPYDIYIYLLRIMKTGMALRLMTLTKLNL